MRIANRVQLTSDGHKAYLKPLKGAFGNDIDCATLVKRYGASPESFKGRYSPAECIGARKERIEGDPDPKHVQHVLRGAKQSECEDAQPVLNEPRRRRPRFPVNLIHLLSLHFFCIWFPRIGRVPASTALSPLRPDALEGMGRESISRTAVPSRQATVHSRITAMPSRETTIRSRLTAAPVAKRLG